MKTVISTLVLLQVLLGAQFAQAADRTQQRWVEDLVSQDYSLIRHATETMYKSGEKSEEMLDIVAEVVLESYQIPAIGFIHIDALAWGMRLLGASGNWRYDETMAEVAANADHKKLRKYAKKFRKQLVKSDAAQYQKGDVSLQALRQ